MSKNCNFKHMNNIMPESCSIVNIHTILLVNMSQDSKLQRQSFDTRTKSVACILTELCLFC